MRRGLIRTWIIIALIVLVPGGLIALAAPHVRAYWKERNRTKYRQAEVKRGDIVVIRNSTGTVQPVLKVQIGSRVSGPITELLVDFNDRVKVGQLMARVDPRLYKAAVARDEAALATATANVSKVSALLCQARNDEGRAIALRQINEEYLADTTMDQYKYNRMSLQAQLEIAKASIKQAQANLDNSKVNLDYTEIRSPYDGIVIDRKIDEGQMLAAQFTTPELFVVAPDMEKEMHIYAAVDEADIGYVRDAQRRKQPVEFTVDAYPQDLFKGTVYQIRMNPTTVQNVVTYPVVIKAPNYEMKLMPGMTANISFQVEECKDVVKVPNAALRFYPSNPSQVRPEDKEILEGTADEKKLAEEESGVVQTRAAAEVVEAGKKRHKRHVWVVDGDFLRAIEITIGTSGNKFSQLVEGDIEPGRKLVSGVEKK